MGSETYSVYVENDMVAEHMPLNYALILTKAIYMEFYNEKNLRVAIKRVPNEVEIEDD